MRNYSECEQDMLIALSSFDSITPDLGASLGEEDAGSCLQKIMHDSNFIEQYDNISNTYRFHPLFSDYLKTCFNKLPEDKKTCF